MAVISRNAYAKINLSLRITGRRDDGYHLMDSLVVFADLHDVVSIQSSDQDDLIIHGAQSASLETLPLQDNILIKSLNLFRERAGLQDKICINLEKNIPVAAGIGGGSTDAAALLSLLNDTVPNPLPKEELDALGLEIGADLPVCLGQYQSPIWRMMGIGENIETLEQSNMCSYGMILINPMVHVSTKDVFNLLGLEKGQMHSAQQKALTFHDMLKNGNDLQSAAETLAPEIKDSLSRLSALSSEPGYIHHGMSGSGATCFALFEQPQQAKDQAAQLQKTQPWVWAGRMMGNV